MFGSNIFAACLEFNRYELSNLLGKLTNCKVKFVATPKYTKKTDVGNFVVDNSKLKSIGWKPKISVQRGLKTTIKFYKKNEI